MLVRFNKLTIVEGTIYAKDSEQDLANDLADQVVRDGNGEIVGLGAKSNEPSLTASPSGGTIYTAGGDRLLGKNGHPLFGTCTLVNGDGVGASVDTTIASAASGALTTYQKIALPSILVDTDGAADTTNSQIIVPSWANYVRVVGHVSFPDQNVGAGHASAHLWRNNGTGPYTAAGTKWASGINADRPTNEAHYHNRVYYPQLASAYYISALAYAGWIPVMSVNEKWTLYAWQNSGGSVTTPAGVENWLTVDFAQFPA